LQRILSFLWGAGKYEQRENDIKKKGGKEYTCSWQVQKDVS
jgi:hypothetical protein